MSSTSEVPGSRSFLYRTLASCVVASIPIFLAGALSPNISADIPLDPERLGLLSGLSLGVSALGSALFGRHVDRLGDIRTMTLGVGAIGFGLIAIGSMAATFGIFLMIYLLFGLAASLIHPAANLHIMTRISAARQGRSLGMKQASMPAATTFAGLFIPLTGTLFGWRLVFVMSGMLTVILAGVVLSAVLRLDRSPRLSRAETHSADEATKDHATSLSVSSWRFYLTVIAFFFAVMSIHPVPLFLTTTGSERQIPPGTLGALMIGFGILSMSSRVVAGISADRLSPIQLTRFAQLSLLFGSVGAMAIALADESPLFFLGIAIAAIFGWAWTPLLLITTFRTVTSSYGRLSSYINIGVFAGTAVGPALFGVTYSRFGAGASYGITSIFGLIAVAAIYAVDLPQRRSRLSPIALSSSSD